ncbi:MAG TPA: biotin/lipoyl-containing protein, partial [Crenalkalicoccus sp.]|nr:biotin/lipoyl-containing protein [Crenalkalicoccus sp.]
MLAINEIKVPDIGDFKDVPIIEVHVGPGSRVAVDDPLITLESDKATMDVPATQAGTVEDVLVKTGDRVSEGAPILRLRAEEAAGEAPVTPPPSVIAQQEPAPQPRPAAPPPP